VHALLTATSLTLWTKINSHPLRYSNIDILAINLMPPCMIFTTPLLSWTYHPFISPDQLNLPNCYVPSFLLTNYLTISLSISGVSILILCTISSLVQDEEGVVLSCISGVSILILCTMSSLVQDQEGIVLYHVFFPS